MAIPKIYPIIDTREKIPFFFKEDDMFGASYSKKLDTGDYTIQGAEDIFSIERKRSISEFAQNISDERFYRELDRLKHFPLSYIICEFSFSSVLKFPEGAGIPKSKLALVKVTPQFILKKICEIQSNYRIPILFCDTKFGGFTMVCSLMKRANEYVWKK